MEDIKLPLEFVPAKIDAYSKPLKPELRATLYDANEIDLFHLHAGASDYFLGEADKFLSQFRRKTMANIFDDIKARISTYKFETKEEKAKWIENYLIPQIGFHTSAKNIAIKLFAHIKSSTQLLRIYQPYDR